MDMYNKIFTKILDSSVWLEPTPTRIVWITFIAAMDETGFCPFAAVGNVATRARVTEAEAKKAIAALEGPDIESSDQDNEGRRIERVPGGWLVLNAPKYRALVTRVNIQEKTKERVRRFREKKRKGNAPVTERNESETPSEAIADTKALKPSRGKRERTKTAIADERHTAFKEAIGRYWTSKNPGIEMPWGPAEGKQLGMFLREAPHITLDQFTDLLRNRFRSEVNHGARPSTWLFHIASFAGGPMDRFGKTVTQEATNGASRSSPTGERIGANVRAVGEALGRRGVEGPWSPPRQDSEEIPQPGPVGRDGGVSGGPRTVSGEVLGPERGGGNSGTPR